MEDAILRNRLIDLVRNINSLDVPTPRNSRPGATDPTAALLSSRNSQELLDSLGFTLKYLIFDLEATRRENAILRSIITQGDE
jgi:hypothetical protein